LSCDTAPSSAIIFLRPHAFSPSSTPTPPAMLGQQYGFFLTFAENVVPKYVRPFLVEWQLNSIV
jgi:hypothetical protein